MQDDKGRMEDGENEKEESSPIPRVDLPVHTFAEEAERLSPRQQEDQPIGWMEGLACRSIQESDSDKKVRGGRWTYWC